MENKVLEEDFVHDADHIITGIIEQLHVFLSQIEARFDEGGGKYTRKDQLCCYSCYYETHRGINQERTWIVDQSIASMS